MGRKKGFTLVELLVVIAIIAVLLAVLLPALASVKEKGKRLRCGYNLSSISKAIGLYADDNSGKLLNVRKPGGSPGTFGSIDYHPYMAYNIDYLKPGTTQLLPMNLACLYSANLISDARAFYCPACTSTAWQWDTYKNPMPWEKLPKVSAGMDSGNNWVRTGYIYRPMDRKWSSATRTYGYAEKLVDINYNKPWVVDTLWSRGSLNHVAGNRNVAKGVYAAFPDGHTNFCSNEKMFSDEYWKDDSTELRPDTWQFQAVLNLMDP